MAEAMPVPGSSTIGTVIRVCRKRLAEPLPSLFVKKAREDLPLQFELFTSHNLPVLEQLADAKIVDYDPGKNASVLMACRSKENDSLIVCNGVPLVPSDQVYDFYRVPDATVDLGEDYEIYEEVEDEQESETADDDDDSNAEDNWRNDYPDEESNDDSDASDNSDLERNLGACYIYNDGDDED